jgi:hypothetical protein
MIGHKYHGATICSKVLIDVHKAFTLSLTYIMLSRVTERRHVKIARRVHPHDFMPVVYFGALLTIP